MASTYVMAPYATEGSPWVELLGWCSVIVYGSIIAMYDIHRWFLFKYLKLPKIIVPGLYLCFLFIICYLWMLPLLTRLFMSPTGFSPNTAVARSVSSQKPTTWAQFFIDLHLVLLLFPAGLGSILLKANPAKYLDDVNSIYLVVCSMSSMVLTSLNSSTMPILAVFSSLLASMVVGDFIVLHVQRMLKASTVMSEIDQEVGGKYSSDGVFKAKRACNRVYGSTVVDISIPPPSFKPVSLSSSRSPLSLKHPNMSFFNVINILTLLHTL